MQEEQKLMVEFQDYPNVLIRMLNNCIKEPHSHLVVFVMQHDVNARLDFIQVGPASNDVQLIVYRALLLLNIHYTVGTYGVLPCRVAALTFSGWRSIYLLECLPSSS